MDGNPAAGPASIREALDRARARRARPLPRRGARARRRARVGALARQRLGRARGVARARRGGAAALRRGDRRAQRARAVPPEALVHVVAARATTDTRSRGAAARRPARDSREPRGARRASRRRRSRARGSSGWSRCSVSTSRSSTSGYTRATSRPTARARRSPQRWRRALAARAGGARHADRLRHVVGRRRHRALALSDELLGRAAVRDGRRPAPPRRRSSSELLADGRYAARRTRRGDGRLLRLGQGRRLPRRAVGDLPRAGGARRRRAPARRRADDLPRPRRQRRARRRPDVRGDRLAAGRLPAGPRQADRAGRDDLVQVRARGAGAPQPRGGARGDAARDLSGARCRRRRQRPTARCSTSMADVSRTRLPRARLGGRALRRSSSASSRRSTSCRCSRSRRARRAARTTPTTSRRCARSRGCSRGRRTACCCRRGSAAAPRSPKSAMRTCAISTSACPFFRAIVDNLEMTLAKSSLSIARGYLSLVSDTEPVRSPRGGAGAHGRRRARRDGRRARCSSASRCCCARSRCATRTSTR